MPRRPHDRYAAIEANITDLHLSVGSPAPDWAAPARREDSGPRLFKILRGLCRIPAETPKIGHRAHAPALVSAAQSLGPALPSGGEEPVLDRFASPRRVDRGRRARGSRA